MAHSLTIGKLRGLRQIANDRGIFTMAAEDQRGSMRKMLNSDDPGSVPAAAMTEVKLDICRALSPIASAMLIDPEFGAAQAISSGALEGHCGLLVSLEDSDYEQVGDDRRAKILEGWGVEKIKRMGASGVKLLAYFRPDRGPGTTYQRDLIARVGEECQKHDIPFILECVGYPIEGMKTDSPEYAKMKAEIVIETARMVSGLGVDVYKAEFPADSKYEQDEKNCCNSVRISTRPAPSRGSCLARASILRSSASRSASPARAAPPASWAGGRSGRKPSACRPRSASVSCIPKGCRTCAAWSTSPSRTRGPGPTGPILASSSSKSTRPGTAARK